MRRNNSTPTPTTHAHTTREPWLRPSPLPTVGLDPAIWSRRVQQRALWQLMEAWHAGRRFH